MSAVEWLPALVLLADCGGNWTRYVEVLYRFFEQDFLDSAPSFGGYRVGAKRHPEEQGKSATFWHLISEGEVESERVPDLRRCERIRWPRPVIEHTGEPVIKVWENKRGNEERVCLWLEDDEYLVVLARRSGYVLLWTAYMVTEPHRKRKLQKEYEAHKQTGAAP